MAKRWIIAVGIGAYAVIVYMRLTGLVFPPLVGSVFVLASIGVYVLIVYLLLTRVADGNTYVPVAGLGMGMIIGDAIAKLFGLSESKLGPLLGAVLFIGPFLALSVVNRWENYKKHRSRRRPNPAELARLESEVNWKPYDPDWLVALAREQRPEDRALHEALTACVKCVESDHRTCFVNPALITDAANVRTILKMSDDSTVGIYYLPWGDIAAAQIWPQSGATSAHRN